MKCSIKKKITTAVFALALGLFGVVAPTVIGVDTQKANAATYCWSNLLSSSVQNDSCSKAAFAEAFNNGSYTQRGPWVTSGKVSRSAGDICYLNNGVIWYA
ncbi:MAG: hypothetical protein LBI63_06160 [Candidatus Ancillula sp.]|jgi:hypothetical protein|nr:hypothetical protein [Candidatus Ancillula sp.]